MEYERIEKVQTGIISPSKLRMKLIGPHHNRKKDGSNSNSSRTSPSRLEDSEFVKNSLLASKNAEFDEEATSAEIPSAKLPVQPGLEPRQHNQASFQSKMAVSRDNDNTGRTHVEQFAKGDGNNSNAVYPMRTAEDEGLDYDSNASSSSFEFHKGERLVHHHVNRSLSRPVPSKWNDAEKWIMNRQNAQSNHWKKTVLQNQTNRLPMPGVVRVAPEHAGYENKLPVARGSDMKRVDYGQLTPQMALEKFSFVASGGMPSSGQSTGGGNLMVDASSQIKDLKEVVHADSSYTKPSPKESTGIPAIREVSMRDMGTEMTPATSQEPSRTATPVGSATPLRSPTSSVPSTPRRGAPAPTPVEHTTDEESWYPTEPCKRELSEEEMKLKTRKEIVALGVQLGKMNIAAWASKEEPEKMEATNLEELERFENEKRAAAWEEAEKSKHTARYKREEIRIQAWESQQRAKLDAEMRRIEARVDQMRAQAQAKMVKKIAMARQRAEEKRAAAEARRNQDEERTAAQAEYIRQAGRLPSSRYICCGWL